ncbi:MAG: class I SAM-dependent methyltransferase [Chlamydiota bacterium]
MVTEVNHPNSASVQPQWKLCKQHVKSIPMFCQRLLEMLDKETWQTLSITNRYWNRMVNYKYPKLEKFVNLAKIETLRSWIDPKLSYKAKNQALNVAQTCYETTTRAIKNLRYGKRFPISPELVNYAAFASKGEIVLEIGGADGAQSALLAFSEANKIYMNDLCKEEVELFKQTVKKLPPDIKKKIKSITGSCFDILKMQPNLKGKVGLLLCDNLIHFFNQEKEQQFLQLMKNLLKSGGIAILTANSPYASPENKKEFEQNPDQTSWKSIYCFVQDYTIGYEPVEVLSHDIVPANNISNDYQQYYPWEKNNATNGKWVENTSAYQALPHSIAHKLKNITASKINSMKKESYKISQGSLRILVSELRSFGLNAFVKMFKKAGFKIKHRQVICVNGHLFTGNDPYAQEANRVGIIIEKK